MYLRFLGTSAGELYPGLWCRCRNCRSARTGGAHDLRQSAALYVAPGRAEDGPAPPAGVLIDFPSEIAAQAGRHGVEAPALTPFALEAVPRPGLVLGYGAVDTRAIEEGVRRLANALRAA